MSAVYLDCNATSFMLPEVFSAMRACLEKGAGNASSLHSFGRSARTAVENAREQVAQAIGAQPDEIIFTSGATEANNFFLKGLGFSKMVLSAIEHPSLIQPAWQRVKNGATLRFLAPNVHGEITAQSLQILLSHYPTEALAVMMANNETGVVNDVLSLARVLSQFEQVTLFHIDAVQALGKLDFSFEQLKTQGAASLSLSAHKIGGPQGVGALVYRRDVDFLPLLAGGGQEQGLRSGTENVAGIVGFGVAAQWAAAHQKEYAEHTGHLRAVLEEGLKDLNATIFGENAALRLPNTSYFAFANIDGATLLAQLDALGFAVGSGSACSSGKTRESYVLKAMQVETALAQASIRVSLGLHNTEEDVKGFLSALSKSVKRLRQLQSF